MEDRTATNSHCLNDLLPPHAETTRQGSRLHLAASVGLKGSSNVLSKDVFLINIQIFNFV